MISINRIWQPPEKGVLDPGEELALIRRDQLRGRALEKWDRRARRHEINRLGIDELRAIRERRILLGWAKHCLRARTLDLDTLDVLLPPVDCPRTRLRLDRRA